jgi:hypothetical protein
MSGVSLLRGAMMGELKSPWSGVGEELLGVRTVEEALAKTGTDWAVTLDPIYTGTKPKITLPGKALCRDGDRFYGTVTDDYRPIQNREVLEWAAEDIQAGRLNLTAGGCLADGEIVWFQLANVEEPVRQVTADVGLRLGWMCATYHGMQSRSAVVRQTIRHCKSGAYLWAAGLVECTRRHVESATLTVTPGDKHQAARVYLDAAETFSRWARVPLAEVLLVQYFTDFRKLVSRSPGAEGSRARKGGIVDKCRELCGGGCNLWDAYSAACEYVNYLAGEHKALTQADRLESLIYGNGRLHLQLAWEAARHYDLAAQ